MDTTHVSNWNKFILLLWKNWKLQWSHKWQLLFELILPAIFSLLLVLVRSLVVTEPIMTTHYDPLDINTLDLFNHSMSNKNAPPEFVLYYSPDNPILDKLVRAVTTSLNLEGYVAYKNANALENALKSDNIFAGIQFNDDWSNLTELPEKFEYALRFPSELRTSTLNIGLTWLTLRLFGYINTPGPRNPNSQDGGLPVGYLREGFLPLQNALSMAYLKEKSQVQTIPEVIMQRYPYPAYISDPLLEGLATMMSLIILLSFIYPATNIAKNITTEKEKQLKEVMKIMGLSNWLHWTAWFVKAFIMLIISAALITLCVTAHWSDNVAVLTYSSYSAVLFFLIIYIIASICFCFMLATFFSRASTASAVTGLIWFVAYVPFSFTSMSYDDLTLATKLGWSLLSNSAMGFGFKLILNFEGTGEGLQWSNFFKPVSVDDSLTVGSIMVVMLVSSVIYMLICLYIEQIMPGEFGVPKKWTFPFTKKFWCGESNYLGIEDMPSGYVYRKNPDAFEVEPDGKHIGLQMRNLQKKFGDKLVVKGVSVNMYEDEITVLLGHNGAGKTTTISMLTGMFPPTAGTAIINGSDIRTNIEGARMSLGICPQHNILFDDMSVSDHLVFFCRLKGLKGEAIQREIDKYLKLIELENKANVASSKLSGGMKRKLSICCALCGNTKVVLCDEPSSGMDPSARRQMWDLLQSEKSGRTILLTTHFMDEADVLGDRIAIMCDGELKCHGTSFFLKKKYGSGYRLICVKRNDCISEEVTKLLSTYIPDLMPGGDIGMELSYQLPDKYSSIFEEMFAALEQQSDDLRLNGYGVSITSMEEVFMKVGAENVSNGQPKTQSAIANGITGYNAGNDDVESVHSEHLFADNTRLLDGSELFKNQWLAMFLKKILYSYRNKLLLLIQNLMSIFFVVVTILIARNQGNYRPLTPMTINLQQYPEAVTVLENAVSNDSSSIEAQIANYYQIIADSYGSNYKFESTGNASFTDYILKLGQTIQVRINSQYLAAATIAKDNITAWLNNQPLHTAPLTVNLVHNAMAKAYINSDAEIIVINAPLPYTPQTLFKQLNNGNNIGTQLATNLCFCMCFVSAFYILFLIKERESRSKLLQFVGGVKAWTFWFTHMLWDLATFILTAVIIIITIACFQEPGYAKFVELMRYLLLMFIFGLSVLPFTYVASYFFTDSATGYARISIINIFAGMALFLVVMVMSFDFLDTKDTANTLSWIFRLFPHFSLALGLNRLYTNVATRTVCETGFVIPPELMCQLLPQCCNLPQYFGWKEPGILPEIVYLLATGFLLFSFLLLREYGIFEEIWYLLKKRAIKPPPPPEEGYFDEDVAKEHEIIVNMSTKELLSQNLVLDRVTKYYGNFLAVNQISLCVKHNECFGLLGVNGAGKTTTFKMMTGDERVSSGAAYVKGMNLSTDMSNIYKEIGYCPQFDALLEDLTGRELLRIFSLLRGVPRSQITQISEEYAKSFGFMKHIDKPTATYSGGNKRKLSTSIAVLGSPSVIFLDEPTTGMDPAARRQLWNMVCRIRDSGKSIVLTSHSMEECEALCTRLAIMVNGEFKCTGSTQHLKNKFSKGLILKIKIKRNVDALRQSTLSNNSITRTAMDGPIMEQQMIERDIINVKAFVEREFQQAVLQEEFQGILTFYIPTTSIKWSAIFGLMERNRDALNIVDYSISQTTLEEIFLDFAKYQREDTRQTKKRSQCRNCFYCKSSADD